MRARSLIVLLAIALASCNSDTPPTADDTERDQRPESLDIRARDVIAASLREVGENDPNALQFSSEEAACVADAVLLGIDVERLGELGLDVDTEDGPRLSRPPLTHEESDVVFGAYERCLDLRAQIGSLLASGGALDADSARCVADEYLASGLLQESLLGRNPDPSLNDRIDAVLTDAFESCTS
ncbi:MAG: hypothetical protein ACXIVQ_13350 [Acidimicrobiales bacterium]